MPKDNGLFRGHASPQEVASPAPPQGPLHVTPPPLPPFLGLEREPPHPPKKTPSHPWRAYLSQAGWARSQRICGVRGKWGGGGGGKEKGGGLKELKTDIFTP